MTVAADVPSFIQIPGNGTATSFAFPFKIFQASDLLVGFVTSSGYTQQTSGFTVLNVDVNGGGNVSFTTAPPSGTTVDIRSVTPKIQNTEFANLGSFLPESHTEAFDRLTRMVQDLYRLAYTFGIHGPDQEGKAWSALPNAAGRAGQMLTFDGNGLPLCAPQPVAGSVTQALIGGLLWPRTGAEVSAGVTPSNYAYPYLDPRRYGAKGDGVTDDSGAFNTAVTALNGGAGTIPVPAGCTFALAASIALNSLTNVTFLGFGGKIVLTANVAAFSFTLCRACNVINVPIYGRYNGGTGYNGQFGIYLSQCGGTLVADCDIHDMVGATGSFGPPAAVSVNSVLIPADLGQALPNIVRNNAIERCTVGVYANGEYEEILGNSATACTTGIWLIAGNCYVTANICQGNNIGCTVDGTGSNADHCLIAGNTFNHNYQCGLELVNIGRSALVTGNIIYAQINYGTQPPFGSTGLYIGVYIGNSSNVNLVGNTIARNQCNLYLDFAAGGGVISSIVSHNTFATDPANTTFNIKYTGTFDFADNIIGRNTFSGTLVASADNNDTDRVVLVGGTIPGAPTFTNSWTNFGSGNASAGYWRTIDNVVHLQGLVTGGAAGTSVFTLPADLWPTQAHHFVTHGSSNPCYVSVNTTGTVVVDNLGGGTYTSLDGVAFRVGT